MNLLLWDLDGTLLDNGTWGDELYMAAASALLGRPVGPAREPIHGKTDHINARLLLRDAGVDEGDLAQLSAEMVASLPGVFQQMVADGTYPGRLQPGAEAVLQACEAAGALNSVLTGNLKQTAEAKLTLLGIAPLLDLETGSYSEDAGSREELLAVAVEHASRKRVVDEVWIIGDTPFDHRVAQQGGVRSMLVATGQSSFEDLAALEPDAVLTDLTETALVVKTLCES